MKNKKIILGIVAFVIIVILGIVLFLFNNNAPEVEDERNEFVENYIELSAEDVGLTLSSQRNNQQVVMELTNLDDIDSFEYEVNYEAIENGKAVRQGTFGSGPNSEERGSSTIRRVIDLGTCSAVCRYHQGVEQVEFTLKVSLSNGEVGIVQETLVLE